MPGNVVPLDRLVNGRKDEMIEMMNDEEMSLKRQE